MERENWRNVFNFDCIFLKHRREFNARSGTGEEKSLRISFERSGGFAGITMKTAVDEEDLAPGEAQKLREMIEKADFFNSPGNITSRSPQPDRFQYELKLEGDDRQHTVTVSEEAMPTKLKPLVNWLLEKSRQTRKGKDSP